MHYFVFTVAVMLSFSHVSIAYAEHNGDVHHEDTQIETQQEAIDEAISSVEALQTTYTIVIKNHKFLPDEIRVPAGEKIKLIVDNQDSTPEEFESDDLRREKIIAGNSKATILVGPIKPGTYHFFGEFNLKTANGHIIAE